MSPAVSCRREMNTLLPAGARTDRGVVRCAPGEKNGLFPKHFGDDENDHRSYESAPEEQIEKRITNGCDREC